MDLSIILHRNIEYKEGRERQRLLLKACEYQAVFQARSLPVIPGICPTYSQVLTISDGFKLFALTNSTADKVLV